MSQDSSGANSAFPGIELTKAHLEAPPLHRLHFLIELVGQKSLPGSLAAPLLEPTWQRPLGNPTVWVMSAGDDNWRPWNQGDTTPSVDSVCLAWPYLTDQGTLSTGSAQHLLSIAERYAEQIGRRALPLPPPEDVPAKAEHLNQIRDNLDAGITILVVSKGDTIAGSEIVRACREQGLEPTSDGCFRRMARSAGAERMVLEVAPFEDAPALLEDAPSSDSHTGLTIGFSIPRSPDPIQSWAESLSLARSFESRWNCVAFDESHRPLGQAEENELQEIVRQAAETLSAAGFTPGSKAAIQLFGL